MARTSSHASIAVTVATVCLSLLCVSAAIWVMLTFGADEWMGLLLLGAGVAVLSNIPSSRVLVSGLDKEAKGSALVAAGYSWQNWVPLSIGFVLVSAAAGTKVAGLAGGLAEAAVVAVALGVFALRWSRRKRRLLAHTDATSLGAGFWVDLIAYMCLLVAWMSFMFYALLGTVGAVVAALASGFVMLLWLASTTRQYRAVQANMRANRADTG